MNKKMLPQLQVGDVIAIHGIGAYSACMDNTYAGQLCCSEYLFENDSLRCLRRAQTEEDYFANMIF